MSAVEFDALNPLTGEQPVLAGLHTVGQQISSVGEVTHVFEVRRWVRDRMGEYGPALFERNALRGRPADRPRSPP